MTTRTRPLPAHGTYARGNGSPGRREPCPCKPCRQAKLKTRKRLDVARQRGHAARVDATTARSHLTLLRTTMSWSKIAEATGCDPRGMQLLLRGARTEINRTTHNKILAVQPAPTPSPGVYIDATGIRRRLQALGAIGYSCIYLANRISTSDARLYLIASGKQPTVRYVLARRIIAIYEELSDTPAPKGRSRTRAIRNAKAKNWASPATWDDDTIDNPQARPEWTGHCGTDRGWWTHRQQNIPVCVACDQAHAQWKAEHNHLPRSEFMSRLSASRASASRRGESIAHDGRELLAQGFTYEHAAERLGITLPYLHHELRRHPVAVDEQEAAA
ncbi:hypothetical protein ACFUIV_18435 [Streptomyces anulatus]|uniref:hypothetical protein n=1 Tax=Streptomyces anulatus TaxID=1892 RepID=UPI0036416EB7